MSTFFQRVIIPAFVLAAFLFTGGHAAPGQTHRSSRNSGGDTGSRASDTDVKEYSDAHNSIRSQYGTVPLQWNNTVAVKAQQWADLCKDKHSGGTLGPLGENLAAGTGDFSITEAVKAWTDEGSDYDPNNPQASHFTQVVWKALTQLGAQGFPGPAQYYVCEYSVQGNVIDPDNVYIRFVWYRLCKGMIFNVHCTTGRMFRFNP
ncbi:CAP domain-containing protein [Mycena latifolia]|nr:CAP domain-containing protein [Mycena latifolia]